MSDDLFSLYEEAVKKIEEAREALAKFETAIKQRREELQRVAKALTKHVQGIDINKFTEFLEEPYAILPKGRGEWWVVAPKFINFQLGWLETTTKSYNIFVVNKYVKWVAEIPPELEEKLEITPPLPATVEHGILKVPPEYEGEAKSRYRQFITRKVGRGMFKIKKGYEFQLISQMVRDGILPFVPKPVNKNDLRHPPDIELTDYQKKALDEFLKWGAIGIYWPSGTGKTFFGAYLCKLLKGRKLIVVPTRTEIEQWKRYLNLLSVPEDEVDLLTYYSYHKVMYRGYNLLILDEAHRLPANTFIRFSTVNAKYRIGLSATPWREDHREYLIFALTGHPVGLSWRHFYKLGIIRKPQVKVYILPSTEAKIKKLEELVKLPLKTIIFCDYIDLRKRIANRLGVPFVYGASKDRLKTIEQNLVTVVSRVGDEGISIKDLERTIEVAFLGKSRRQEAQRAFRLLHSTQPDVQHIILMTRAEFEKYHTRLYSLIEKGFRIEVV